MMHGRALGLLEDVDGSFRADGCEYEAFSIKSAQRRFNIADIPGPAI